MKLSEIYPEEYFNHWIAMFSANNTTFDNNSIKEQVELYKFIEGEEEFLKLKEELKSIIKNGDLEQFIRIGKDFGLKQIDNNDLKNMVKIIGID